MQHNLQIIYIVLFAAISIEILALCNAITLLCARYIGTVTKDRSTTTTRTPSRRRWITKPTEIIPEETIPMGSMDHHKNLDQKKMIDSVISANSDERHYRQY